MGNKNISVIGKKLDIFFSKFDFQDKVGSIKLSEKDLESKADFIKALQKVTNNLDNGTYTIHHTNELFARFNIVNNQVVGLHKYSENTGIIMPCWNYFEE